MFSQHNLVTDRSFSEFNVIFCRNVLIYFDRTLQNRVHALFYDSLVDVRRARPRAARSRSRFTRTRACYEKLDAAEKLYRRTGVDVRRSIVHRHVLGWAAGARQLLAGLPDEFDVPVVDRAAPQHRSDGGRPR